MRLTDHAACSTGAEPALRWLMFTTRQSYNNLFTPFNYPNYASTCFTPINTNTQCVIGLFIAAIHHLSVYFRTEKRAPEWDYCHRVGASALQQSDAVRATVNVYSSYVMGACVAPNRTDIVRATV